MPRVFVSVAALMLALAGGTMAGTAAVGGMTQLYRGAEPPALGAERDALAWAREEAVPASEPEPVRLAALPTDPPSVACVDCSDFDVGYRWAAAHDPEDARRCAAGASAFADGCAAWIAAEDEDVPVA